MLSISACNNRRKISTCQIKFEALSITMMNKSLCWTSVCSSSFHSSHAVCITCPMSTEYQRKKYILLYILTIHTNHTSFASSKYTALKYTCTTCPGVQVAPQVDPKPRHLAVVQSLGANWSNSVWTWAPLLYKLLRKKLRKISKLSEFFFAKIDKYQLLFYERMPAVLS